MIGMLTKQIFQEVHSHFSKVGSWAIKIHYKSEKKCNCLFVFRLETGMKMEIHHRQAPIIPVVLPLVSLRANSSHCPFIGIIRHFIHNTFPLINVMKSRHYHRLLCSQITHWTAPLKVKKIRIECYLPKLEEKRRSASFDFAISILICILGRSSIWTCRISNICFVYFRCACIRGISILEWRYL